MRSSFKLLASLSLVSFIFSCNKDFTPMGEELLADQTLSTNSQTFPVFTYQEGVDKVQSNVQPLIQLGTITHPVFGKSQASIVTQLSLGSNPVFGDLSQAQEDEEDPSSNTIIPENETVTAVYLEIPFFTNQNDKDNDGVIDSLDADPEDPESNSDGDELSDIIELQSGLNPLSSDSDGDGILDHNDDENDAYESENKVYEIDSLYGNPNASFDLKVYELMYFLNTLDPAKNFESTKIYYSNDDYFEKGFYNSVLHDERITLNFDELRFNFKEDDPSTEGVDESTRVEARLSPRIRVPLDTSFFQEHLLDKEGKASLESNAAFQQALKGIIIRTDNFSEDLYMLLNIQEATIEIEYEYDKYDTNGTPDELIDDTTVKATSDFTLNLSGIRVNTLKNFNSNPLIQELIANTSLEEPTDKLCVQGGKYHGKIRLFSSSNEVDESLLNNLRSQNWLINQAKLVFYLDPEQPDFSSELLSPRLYLYRYDSGQPLLDYFSDNSVTSTSANSGKTTYGGVLEYDSSNNPLRYTFDVTNHISNIIKNDSINFDLGLVVTGDINDNTILDAIKLSSDNVKLNYPRGATLSPLGSVLVGSHPNENLSDKKVQLQLTYSSY
jgi:hypothetical protein